MKLFKIPTCKEVYNKKHKCHEGEEMCFKDKLLTRLHLYLCHNCQKLEKSFEVVESKMKKIMCDKMNPPNCDQNIKNLIEKIKSDHNLK